MKVETAKDISETLPAPMRKAFELQYAKQDPIRWDGGESCSRCGAYCFSYWQYTHELWHKNISCQLWMLSRFPTEHLIQHREEAQAIAGVIGGILGFIDPEGEVAPSTYPTFEGPAGPRRQFEGDMQAYTGPLTDEHRHAHETGKPHTHEDGTRHVH